MVPFILNLTARHIEWSTSVILNLGTLPTLCVGGKEPLRHIQHEAGCGPKPVLMSTEQRYTFKDNALFCCTSARHLAHLPNTKYRISLEGRTVLLISVTDS